VYPLGFIAGPAGRVPSAALREAAPRPLYDRDAAAAYASTRMPACYAMLHRVFNELHMRLPGFRPATMLDFGSGPGTAIWAAAEVRRFLGFSGRRLSSQFFLTFPRV
jgi:ribosomal protein RSM22 (predicted rRNA methylase)